MQLDINELAALLNTTQSNKTVGDAPWQVGEAWFFRTVTMAQVGVIAEILGDFLVLKSASWIADTGRFHDALQSGNFSEIEPFPNGCVVNVRSIVDACKWVHELPKDQK